MKQVTNGKELKAFLEKTGMSYRQLAAVLGYKAHNTVYEWVHDCRPIPRYILHRFRELVRLSEDKDFFDSIGVGYKGASK